MELNLGRTDMMIRAVMGVTSLYGAYYVAFVLDNVWGLGLGFMGGILLMSALMKWCPVYALIGFNSCPISGHKF